MTRYRPSRYVLRRRRQKRLVAMYVSLFIIGLCIVGHVLPVPFVWPVVFNR